MLKKMIDTSIVLLWWFGIPHKRRVRYHLSRYYMMGLRQGYELAVRDFFGAEVDGRPDENWYVHMPSLHRTIGGLKRWHKE